VKEVYVREEFGSEGELGLKNREEEEKGWKEEERGIIVISPFSTFIKGKIGSSGVKS
jgi:hypothetical protein